MADEDGLPDYQPMLAAYHRAFAVELRAMIAALPIREGDRVLDAACGDGAYTPWLAGRVGPTGSVVAFDLLPAYLKVAARRAGRGEHAARAGFVAGSIDRPPFEPASFDAAWCAQSLFSLPEPVDSVRKIAGLVRPGGLVAILEDDTLHQVLLPWPIEVELAVRKAEWDAFREESDHPRKFYVGRRLVGVFRKAGLVDVRVDTRASDRIAPLDAASAAFLRAYLDDLVERVAPRLGAEDRRAFDRVVDPASPDCLVDQTDLAFTCVDHVVTGRVPGA